jgi:predicted Zn-dependent protease
VILTASVQAPLLLALMVIATEAIGQSQRDAMRARAETLLAQMEFSRALTEAQVFNRAMPDEIVGYQLMAAAQIELGDYADAEKQIQWMLDLRIGKADSTGWLLVARFREAIGDVDGALEAVNLAVARLQPGQNRESETLAAYAARLLCINGKPALAEQAVGRFASTPGAAADTLQALAEIRLAQGRRAEAVEILRRLAASGPPHPRLLYMLAEATNAATDYVAFEHAACAITANPDNANRELALYYAGPGKQPAKAVEVARRESLRRHDILTLDALAVALFANHQKSEAHDVMQRVLAVGTRRPEILRHAARIGIKQP